MKVLILTAILLCCLVIYWLLTGDLSREQFTTAIFVVWAMNTIVTLLKKGVTDD